MTNRDWLQSLSDDEFAKYIKVGDGRFHICDYKHELQNRCEEMGDDCHACMVDFLRAEHIEEE